MTLGMTISAILGLYAARFGGADWLKSFFAAFAAFLIYAIASSLIGDMTNESVGFFGGFVVLAIAGWLIKRNSLPEYRD